MSNKDWDKNFTKTKKTDPTDSPSRVGHLASGYERPFVSKFQARYLQEYLEEFGVFLDVNDDNKNSYKTIYFRKLK